VSKSDKLLTTFLIFVCIYQLLFGLMAIVSPGEAYRFIILTNNPPGGSLVATSWWNDNLPHWWIYQRFNQFYVLSMIITLVWVKKRSRNDSDC